MTIRLALVAPNRATRLGLRSMLESADSLSAQAEVVCETPYLDPQELAGLEIDIVLLIAPAFNLGEVEALSRSHQGSLGILLLTDEPRAGDFLSRLPLRGWGILRADAAVEELSAAVYAISVGLAVGNTGQIEPASLRRLVQAGGFEASFTAEPLTDREGEVLQLLGRGLANKQIASALGISEHTVKFHIASIYSKLGVSNRAEAVRTGIQQGLIII